MSTEITVRRSDVVVVGGGVAGLAAALAARGRRVTLLAKAPVATCSASSLAQGGVAVALGIDDSPERHAADTLAAGAGLCDLAVVAAITAEGPRRIRELLARGARLDRATDGSLALGREAAHACRRVVHARDATGAELVRALAAAVAAEERIVVEEGVFVVDLLVHRGRVVGVATVDAAGRRRLELAAAVVLATGGIGQAYLHTTNPLVATGDGLAMAARAGARLAGLELVQFHPTALDDGGNPAALLTEALRGEGATVVDESGRRFLVDLDPAAELAARDVVARAIWRHGEAGHRVFLDARAVAAAERFPTVWQLCAARGLDPAAAPLPIAPAAHYHMGGVVVDLDGRSSLPGLWACGEVASTGLHGANRLASNSLLEALVIGSRLGEALAGSRPQPLPPAALPTVCWPTRPPWLAADDAERAAADQLRRVMWQGVGLERSESGLARAESELAELAASPRSGELANLLTVARLVARAARLRTESRGAHFRTDFPFSDHHWRQDLRFDGLVPLAPRPLDLVRVAAG
jgi:L-aspartate oxidase